MDEINRKRGERLAILEDRLQKGKPEADDLSNAIKLAHEAHEEVLGLRKDTSEADNWRDLIMANTISLDTSIRQREADEQAMRRLHGVLEPLIGSSAAKAQFWTSLGVMVSSLRFWILLLTILFLTIGGVFGFLQFEKVQLDGLPGLSVPAPTLEGGE